ncbi:6-pyruvoyl trahydropterin synthase family protein [Nonomuraea dietziae]|uniref:6-pyruvoyl trahydropterin synthase family protein n=1 Tax=Nonomuraea dietziae TaxID=65515 RepID=UPI0033C355FC
MYTAQLGHHFHAAHRLPHIDGKCRNLHGHTWHAAITLAAPTLNSDGMLVEFSAFKNVMRAWIDAHLDHGAMLGTDDPLARVLQAKGSRVFVFGEDHSPDRWPTVESVAGLLAQRAAEWLAAADPRSDAYIARVDVAETPSNSASWVNPALIYTGSSAWSHAIPAAAR